MIRRTICRVRGHRYIRDTLRLDNQAKTVCDRCLRCGQTTEPVTRSALVRVDGSAVGVPTTTCYTTGETGECGHPLADCWCRCGGSYCPRCQERCTGCQRLADAVSSLARDALTRMERELFRPAPAGGEEPT